MDEFKVIEQLNSLGLKGMSEQFALQMDTPSSLKLSHAEFTGQLVQAQEEFASQRRIATAMRNAKFKMPLACLEDIHYDPQRGLKESEIANLASCQWAKRNMAILITGATGTGKSYLGCALGIQVIRNGMKALCFRLPNLLEQMEIARADGSMPSLRRKINRADVLFLDDWGLVALTQQGRQDLMEIVEDFNQSGSIIITSQLPISKWHEYLGEATIADAILDRLIHNAHKIQLKGDSMRKVLANKENLS